MVIERDPDTGLFVGYVPGWPGAHSQGEAGALFVGAGRCEFRLLEASVVVLRSQATA